MLDIEIYIRHVEEDTDIDCEVKDIDSETYVKMLEDEMNRSRANFDNMINGIGSKESLPYNIYTDKDTDIEVKYVPCKAVLENMDIDGLLKHFRDEDEFDLNIKFGEMNIEFLGDFNVWYEMSKRIEKSKNAHDLKFFIVRDATFKFKFINNSGKIAYGEFQNCNIVKQMDDGEFVIHVKKIIFTKEF